MLKENTSDLTLKKINYPDLEVRVYCDISCDKMRPYVPEIWRRAVFNALHGLAHPGVKATQKLITERFVWPSMKKDCRLWEKSCLPCQRAKVTQHVISPVGNFYCTGARFQHVHLDIIGPLPSSLGFRYCLTIVDRFTRWPEAIPITDIETMTIARAFVGTWIARFGVPLRITTDPGQQFESKLFNELAQLIGTTHLRTTAYHPAANGMVERLHRQMKAPIKYHETEAWEEVLPIILLGIRAAVKEDLKANSAELVYGTTIRLPSDFFQDSGVKCDSDYVDELRKRMRSLKPVPGTRHGTKNLFIFKEMPSSPYVFVRRNAVRRPLENTYDGPFEVASREDKYYTILINGKKNKVSIDRLKPAFILNEEWRNECNEENFMHVQQHEEQSAERVENQNRHSTRAGRNVRFPDRLQTGF